MLILPFRHCCICRQACCLVELRNQMVWMAPSSARSPHMSTTYIVRCRITRSQYVQGATKVNSQFKPVLALLLIVPHLIIHFDPLCLQPWHLHRLRCLDADSDYNNRVLLVGRTTPNHPSVNGQSAGQYCTHLRLASLLRLCCSPVVHDGTGSAQNAALNNRWPTVAAACVLNNLLPAVTPSPSLVIFKRRLKTELFLCFYPNS